jgi:hypothetical protein
MKHRSTFGIALLTAALSSGTAAAQSVVNFDALILRGEANPRPWCGQWWGHRCNGVAINQGNNRTRHACAYPDRQSPAEKLDRALGRAKKIEYRSLDTWLTCALRSWEDCSRMSGQARSRCLKDGKKQAAYRACRRGFTIDTAYEYEVVHHGQGAFGWDDWWGHCNSWAAAAILYAEPKRAVRWQNVNWTVADVKGLLTETFMDTDLAADGWFGCRYDGPGATDTFPGECDTEQDAYRDVTPRQFLSAMSKHIGSNRHGVVVDRHTEWEVWNHPVWKYEIANCRDGAGAPCDRGETRRTCTASFTWAEDGVRHDEVCTPPRGYTTRTLAFSVCLRDGVIQPERRKQRWEVPESVERSERWPDFIWVPGRLGAAQSANPYVHRELDRIVQLQRMSAGPEGVPPDPRTMRPYPKTVNQRIPDGDPRGVSVSWSFPGGVVKSVGVCVEIDHPYRGDLVVTLRGPDGTIEVLWNKQGGGENNLNDCAGATSFLNRPLGGTWRLEVADVVARDVGTWKNATLKLAR